GLPTVRSLGGTKPASQGTQGFGNIAAHPGREQPYQGPRAALHLNPLDHPDTSPADRLERVLEDHLAQRHRAFADPAPSGLHRGDGERATEIATLLCPAAGARLKRTVEARHLLADIPLGPARHLSARRPDLGGVGLERCLAFE